MNLLSRNTIKNMTIPPARRTSQKIAKALDATLKLVAQIGLSLAAVVLQPRIELVLLGPAALTILTAYAALMTVLAIITVYQNRDLIVKTFLRVLMSI